MSDTAAVNATLAQYRASIDNIDAALIHMLAERFRCTKAVGLLKATHNLPPADPARETQQIARLRQLAHDAHLDPDFAEKFLNFVIKEVIRHHEQIAASSSGAANTAASSSGAANIAASSSGAANIAASSSGAANTAASSSGAANTAASSSGAANTAASSSGAANIAASSSGAANTAASRSGAANTAANSGDGTTQASPNGVTETQ